MLRLIYPNLQQVLFCWSGNELCGSGVGTRVAAAQYASDTISLYNIVKKIYSSIEPKPLVIAPGGFYDANWFKEFVDKTGNSVDAITHHIYNLGPGISLKKTTWLLWSHTLDNRSNLTWLYPLLVQELIHISLKRSLTHPILMVRLGPSIASKALSRVLQLQQLHGLVNQEGLTTVAVTLLPMHSCLVSGKGGQNLC